MRGTRKAGSYPPSSRCEFPNIDLNFARISHLACFSSYAVCAALTHPQGAASLRLCANHLFSEIGQRRQARAN